MQLKRSQQKLLGIMPLTKRALHSSQHEEKIGLQMEYRFQALILEGIFQLFKFRSEKKNYIRPDHSTVQS